MVGRDNRGSVSLPVALVPGACLLALGLAVGSLSWSGRQTSQTPAAAPTATEEQVATQGFSDAPFPELPDRPADALWPANLLTDEYVAQQHNIPVDLVRKLHEQRSLDNEQLSQISPAKLQRALWRLKNPKADEPGEAIKWRLQRHRDAFGKIRPDGLANAIREREALVKQGRAGTAGIPSGPTGDLSTQKAGLSPTKWEWLGPGNIGGRTRAMLIDPSAPNTYYAAGVGGGVWKSTNAGAQWTPLTNLSANLAVCALAMNPVNTQNIFAGTGEGFFNGDALQGNGVFVTSNGGSSWSQLASTNNPNFREVNRIAISRNGSVILVATNTGLFRSTNGGVTFSTPTGGVAIRMLDCDFHPTDSTRCICSTSGARVWVSSDGGASFTPSNGLSSTGSGFSNRAEVCYARANPSTIYASVDRGGGTIFRSTDNGLNFTQTGTGANYLGSQGWYDNIIWADDPTNVNRVIVGGIDLWRSTDGGATLARISNWTQAPLSAHADHHMIITPPAYNGAENQTLLFGNDGGVYRGGSLWGASPANVTWQELNNNYGVTQFYGGDGNATSGRYHGGTQDNGTNVFNPGANATENWDMYIGGDGGFAAADPTDPNYLYGEFQWLGLHRSSNGGLSAQYIAGNLPEAAAGQTNFISPFILDPNDPRRLIAGAQQLWVTADARAGSVTFTSIKPAAADLISAIAINPANSDQMWVGHNNGDVFSTANGRAATPTWVKRDGTTLPNRYCERIAVDPRNGNTVFVSFGGFNAGNLWKTTDGGATWTNVSTGLPSAPINGVCHHPTKAGWVYVGTEVGVFGSEDGGATWSATNEGPLNVAVDEVKFVGNFLLAVTHGRGMYRINPDAGGGGGGGGGGGSNIVDVAWNNATKTLTLTGDGAANGVSLSKQASNIRVTGGTGVKIRYNGVSSSSATITGAAALPVNITGELGAGADTLSVLSLAITNINVNLGAGADRVTLMYCTVGTSAVNGGVDTDTDTFTATTSRITTRSNINFP